MVELLKLGPGQRLRQVHAVDERLDGDPGMVLVAHCLLGTLARRPQIVEGGAVAADVLSVLAPDQPDEVVRDSPVEVLPSEERVVFQSQGLVRAVDERQDARLGRATADVARSSTP